MKKRSNLITMLKMLRLVAPLSGYMILAIIMGVINNIAVSSITVLAGYALLQILGYDYGIKLSVFFIAMIICAVIRGVLRYAEQACNHFIAFKLLAHIRDRVFGALRKLCPAKLEGRNRGELINIITSDIELLEVFYAHTISPIVIAVIFYVLVCIYIGSVGTAGLAVYAAICYVIVGVILPVIISKISSDTGMKLRDKAGKLAGFMLDNLRGVGETLQYGDCAKRMQGIATRTDDLLNTDEKMKNLSGANKTLSNSLIMAFDLGMLFAGLILLYNGEILFDGLVITLLLFMGSFGPAAALSNLGTTLLSTLASGNRVLDILEEKPVINDVTGREEIGFSGAELKNVEFSYADDKILDGVSMEFPEGEITGICGKSGSGKSTILKLLMRFWDADAGSVSLSGVKVSDINTDNLRAMESFMTQDTFLYHDSIANNLRIARLDATDEEIMEACRKASVHDFIMSLKDGYDTKVSELGSSLSGGERQRLGLARAFLHDSKLLLLDEPTSNLDSLNEAVILRALRDERHDKTVVLVSHRASTVKIADKIYNMESERAS
ncbi:MAG: ABC transporter ATP-binding protein/permease [Lachnospiraceae bacterium]|nr:ABC transporter ATP-binding protein/permease [Lachnospiraceae bacterium]